MSRAAVKFQSTLAVTHRSVAALQSLLSVHSLASHAVELALPASQPPAHPPTLPRCCRAWRGSGERPFLLDNVWDLQRVLDYLQQR